MTYTASIAPFSAVHMIISNLVEADFTVYTMTVDNGVADAMDYLLFLSESR